MQEKEQLRKMLEEKEKLLNKTAMIHQQLIGQIALLKNLLGEPIETKGEIGETQK